MFLYFLLHPWVFLCFSDINFYIFYEFLLSEAIFYWSSSSLEASELVDKQQGLKTADADKKNKNHKKYCHS